MNNTTKTILSYEIFDLFHIGVTLKAVQFQISDWGCGCFLGLLYS